MTASLTVDRSNLSLPDLVFGQDLATGFVIAPGLSFGTVTWRKHTEQSDNIAGRQLIDYVRDASVVSGTALIAGTNETSLQSRISEAITALTQVDATLGFQTFTLTFTHGAAVYSCTATEPGDITPGDDGVFDDMLMEGNFIQPLGFTIVRNPIALSGPI